MCAHAASAAAATRGADAELAATRAIGANARAREADIDRGGDAARNDDAFEWIA